MIWGNRFLLCTIGSFLLYALVLLPLMPCLSGLQAQQLTAVGRRVGQSGSQGLGQDSIVIGKGLSTFLEPNAPNPFISTTTIAYTLGQETSVLLRVYDYFFNVVETLVDSGSQPAGRHVVPYTPQGIPSGMYFYELKTSQGIERKRMLYIR